MKFIHTADLHIDQPFANVTTDDAGFQQELQQVNHAVLKKIVNQCIEESVDFLLVVGDTFHQARSSIYTQEFIMNEFKRLEEYGIQVIMSFGNHDYYTENRYWFEWPENVTLFTKEEVTTKVITLKNNETVAISGFSYEHQWITQDKALDYPERDLDTTYHIGLYHGEIGSTGQYAPFLVSELNPRYDYWALGHIHKSEKISTHPLAIYPGIPQGHTKKEKNGQGIVLVEVESNQVDYRFIPVSIVGFETIEMTLKEDLERHLYLSKLIAGMAQEDWACPINFVTVVVKPVTGQLMSELIAEKEEILHYLQTKLLQQTAGNIWLMDLVIESVETDKLIMGFDASLIDDLSAPFAKKDEFYKLAKDILQQPVIAANIQFDEEDVKLMVQESTQLVKDKMIFKNEASQ